MVSIAGFQYQWRLCKNIICYTPFLIQELEVYLYFLKQHWLMVNLVIASDSCSRLHTMRLEHDTEQQILVSLLLSDQGIQYILEVKLPQRIRALKNLNGKTGLPHTIDGQAASGKLMFQIMPIL